MMTREDQEAFAEVLSMAMVRALQQGRSVSDSEHFDHHQWIKAKMDAERARAAFWGEMAKHAAKLGIASLITSVGFAFYLGVKQIIHNWTNGG